MSPVPKGTKIGPRSHEDRLSREAPVDPSGPIAAKLEAARIAMKLTREELCDRARLGHGTYTRNITKGRGRWAPNHPMLPQVVAALGLNLDEVVKGATEEPVTERHVRRITAMWLAPGRRDALRAKIAVASRDRQQAKRGRPAKSPGKAVVVHDEPVHPAPAPPKVARAPRATATVVSHKASGDAKTLARLDANLRRLLAFLTMQANSAAMMDAPQIEIVVPTAEFGALLADYYSTKGVRAKLVLPPDFARLFS